MNRKSRRRIPRSKVDFEKKHRNEAQISNKICKIELRTYVPVNLLSRRFISTFFVLLIAVYGFHVVLIRNKGITEVELLNDLMERSKLAYANSISYSRQNNNPNTRPGFVLRQKGAVATYPVVMVPGFITSGLELWDGEECARSYYRQKLWGSLPVFVQSFFTDNECWRRHLSLDPNTGKDPKNIRLRSVQGFEATDYVMSTFWVWEKIIENLADVGYDASNMIMMPYDWRLSFIALEERDGYLTKLRFNIEAMVKTSGKKVVLTSHSMGSQIVLFFFKWVTTSESKGGGGGGKDWVDKHIHSFVNIAGPVLGVPKAVTALLSGEMKDTAAIMGTMGAMVERIFGRKNRQELWKTWGSLWAMLPKGGDAIWSHAGDMVINSPNSNGVLESSPDKGNCSDAEGIPLITFEDNDEEILGSDTWSLNESIKYLKYWGNEMNNSVHAAQVHSFQSEGKISMENWHDPTATPLPFAPSMKMYCLYGVGIETERAYFYKYTSSSNYGQLPDQPPPEDSLPFLMDTAVNDPVNNIRFGTRFSDGDVSVPLVSLGYMCVDGWNNNKRLNPSKVDIVTREYLHQEEFRVNDPMRGGPHSSDHVDILGNVDTTLDLLKVVTDFDISSVNEDSIVSDIKEIAMRISSRSNPPKRSTSEKLSELLPWTN
jgi:phospholipid:diacylglycerol acyltransferase